MTSRPLTALLAFACLQAPTICSAQGPSGEPEQVARDVLRADSLHDWRLLLALAHPAALREYRFDQVRSLTFQDNMPGFAAMKSCLQRYRRSLLDSVYRVPDADSLSRLAPESVFARAQRFVASRTAGLAVDTLLPSRVVLGHVVADDSTAYVVIEERYPRRPTPDWPERLPKIMTFRLYRGTWRTMLDPDIGQAFGSVMFEGNDCG